MKVQKCLLIQTEVSSLLRAFLIKTIQWKSSDSVCCYRKKLRSCHGEREGLDSAAAIASERSRHQPQMVYDLARPELATSFVAEGQPQSVCNSRLIERKDFSAINQGYDA